MSRENCQHDYDNPIRKGRAHYVCRHCGEDLTLRLVMLQEAQMLGDDLSQHDEPKGKPGSKSNPLPAPGEKVNK